MQQATRILFGRAARGPREKRIRTLFVGAKATAGAQAGLPGPWGADNSAVRRRREGRATLSGGLGGVLHGGCARCSRANVQLSRGITGDLSAGPNNWGSAAAV